MIFDWKLFCVFQDAVREEAQTQHELERQPATAEEETEIKVKYG
jgi:hypothetical protein